MQHLSEQRWFNGGDIHTKAAIVNFSISFCLYSDSRTVSAVQTSAVIFNKPQMIQESDRADLNEASGHTRAGEELTSALQRRRWRGHLCLIRVVKRALAPAEELNAPGFSLSNINSHRANKTSSDLIISSNVSLSVDVNKPGWTTEAKSQWTQHRKRQTATSRAIMCFCILHFLDLEEIFKLGISNFGMSGNRNSFIK